jgi:hypothetical protein
MATGKFRHKDYNFGKNWGLYNFILELEESYFMGFATTIAGSSIFHYRFNYIPILHQHYQYSVDRGIELPQDVLKMHMHDFSP